MLINTAAYAAPSNEELFQMILDLKKEVADSKSRETELKSKGSYRIGAFFYA